MRSVLPSVVSCVVAGLVAATGLAGERVCGTLADAFVAEELGLRREWIVQVPFNTTATRLERVTVADGIVIATAGDGSLHGIAAPLDTNSDAEMLVGRPAPGTLLWSHFPNRTASSLHAPAVGSGIVVISGEFEAVGIDLPTGRTLWREPLSSPAVGTAAISGDWVYVPIEGGRLIRLAINPYREPVIQRVIEKKDDGGKESKGKSDIEATRVAAPVSYAGGMKTSPMSLSTHGNLAFAPLPLKGGVLWCTTDGLLTWLAPGLPRWSRSEFLLGRPPAGQPLITTSNGRTAIFLASNTGPAASDVVRIDLLPTGLVFAWREPLDDAVAGKISLTAEKLLVPMGTGGLAALSATDGKRLWTHPRQVRLLSVTSGRLWCIDDMGRLAKLDAADGRRLDQFCLTPFRVPVINDTNDRLILASPGGIVAALAPRSGSAPLEPSADKPVPEAKDDENTARDNAAEDRADDEQ